jgi:uncharacterized protein (TIGR03083 family)
MQAQQFLPHLRRDSDLFLELAPRALNKSIPTCPGWKGNDLVAHLAVIWRWAGDAVLSGVAPPERQVPPADSGAELIEWSQIQRDHLLSALEAADPDAPSWTFGPPKTQWFWFRRQALETAIHLVDLQLGAKVPVTLDEELSVEGAQEFLTVVIGRILRRQPGEWAGEVVRLISESATSRSIFSYQFGPEGVVSEIGETQKADLEVAGPSRSLYLWCTNRGDASELTINGDDALLHRWQQDFNF